LADEISKLRDDARDQAVAQRVELDQRSEKASKAADERAAIAEAASDDRRLRLFAGIGIAVSIGAGIFLRLAGVPAAWAAALPGAVTAACTFLLLWPTISAWLVHVVQWILLGVGVLLGLTALAALAIALRYVFQEWHHAMERLRGMNDYVASQVNADSLKRQPRVVRWLIDLLHLGHPAAKKESAK
jgi:cation transport ATPase